MPEAPSLFAPTHAIATDRRRVDYAPQPEAIARARELIHELRRVELELGAVLATIDASRAYVDCNASSVEQLASRMGLAPEEARRYRDLGRAVAAQPSVGERVARLALPTTRAAVLAPVLRRSAEPRSELDRILGVLPRWVAVAERTSTRALRRLVRREMTERRTGEAVVDLTFHATETTREHFERARVLSSRKAGKRLSADATFAAVVEDYVARHDPLLVEDGTRRVGPTSERPRDRYVPVCVRRDVRRRAGDRCEVPGCAETTFLQFAHRRAHRLGSGREAHDLFLLCWLHHAMFDAGQIRVVGPTGDPSWVQTSLGTTGYVCTREVPGGRPVETEEEARTLREMLAAEKRARRRGERPPCEHRATGPDPDRAADRVTDSDAGREGGRDREGTNDARGPP